MSFRYIALIIPDDGSSSEVIDKATGYRRVFIKATIKDNPYLHNTEYERSLAALPEASRKALLEGKWDVYEGGIFCEWDYHRHTCEPFEVPETWEMWRSCDDGYAAPACGLWFAYDKVNDRVFCVDELYERGLTPEELAFRVLTIDRKYERSLSGPIDSAAFAEIGLSGDAGGGGSRGDVMNALGCRWSPSEKGAGSRIHGISVIHTRLMLKPDGFGGLMVFRHCCPNLVRSLPSLVYSRSHPEDIDDSCEQHAVDALRYGLTRKRHWFAVEPVYGI